MGLYLAVFDGDDEIDGVEVGLYYDFSCFRNIVVEKLERGNAGSKYPVLILHSDCDGLWSVEEAFKLEQELKAILIELETYPPFDFHSDWQKKLANLLGIQPNNLAESFIDVDGESLIERLIKLCKISQQKKMPILFQ
jgi:hypothetical protein